MAAEEIPELNPAALIAGALSLTAALAWNEAAKTGIAALVPGEKGTFGATLAYAVAVTVLVVVILAMVRTVHQNFDKIKSAITIKPAADAAAKQKPANDASADASANASANDASADAKAELRERLLTHRIHYGHCH